MELLRINETTEALRIEGEIDFAAADQLADALRTSIASGVTTVDLSGVTFFDSEGLSVLLSAGNALDGQGPLVLLRPSKPVRRVLDIAMPGGVPTLTVLDE
jgi:anti-anti-sigma factor